MPSLLQPYAVPEQGMLGRVTREEMDATRTPFQRDRGRIIHTQAFRRLQGKTQVFIAGEGDHFRTRLTHTMEVAQIARDIARTLGLNEDLAECIALAHDLGHPPFGHMGEEALNGWMKKHGSYFEHNEQSIRIVTLLEEHAPFIPGLNLNREVIDGLRKHSSNSEREGRALSLEAQAVNIADAIAYTGHDCEDGLRAGLFAEDELRSLTLTRLALERASVRRTSLRGAIIHELVSDLYAASALALRDLRSLQDVYGAPHDILAFSVPLQSAMSELRAFLYRRMYEHPVVMGASRAGQALLLRLCDRYEKAPTEKILLLQKRTQSSLTDAIKDYIAGMTDSYARGQEVVR